MFEKEAEEYLFDRLDPKVIDSVSEFSNKHIEEAIVSSFKDGAEFGYNKANEWHFVKDELPPIEKKYGGRSEFVLVLSKELELQYAQYVEKEKTWGKGICEINFEPYAWKEIVLPKEKEWRKR